MSKITVASTFAGCGGLDYGFKLAGYDIQWANELSEDACKSYESLIGHVPTCGDINDFIKDIPSVDVLIGGPPCQSFSLVGKRVDGDERGKLVFSFYNAVKSVSPKAFVMENVPGFAASKFNGVRLNEVLLGMFEKLGYNVKMHKLIASDFCVPQKRKRIVIIGIRKEFGSLDFVSPDYVREFIKYKKGSLEVTSKEALGDLPNVVEGKDRINVSYLKKADNSFLKFVRGGQKEVDLHNKPTMSEKDALYVKYIYPGGNYMDIPNNIATPRIMKFKETGGRTTCYGRLHPDKPSYTLNTYFNRPNVGTNYHYEYDRLISVREALRIQSFPDSFSPHYSSQRSLHQQVGNAVPPLMALGIALNLKEVLCK